MLRQYISKSNKVRNKNYKHLLNTIDGFRLTCFIHVGSMHVGHEDFERRCSKIQVLFTTKKIFFWMYKIWKIKSAPVPAKLVLTLKCVSFFKNIATMNKGLSWKLECQIISPNCACQFFRYAMKRFNLHFTQPNCRTDGLHLRIYL